LEHAAEAVDRRFPGSILLVGDLSRREGGALSGHVSHESGRDADVGFYYTDERGRSVRTPRLLAVAPSGAVPYAAGLRFDEARNWTLIASLLRGTDALVQSIFVADYVERRLLDYARRQGIGSELVDRAAKAMRQPSGSPHDDHFHVRIACPREPGQPQSEGDRVCIPDPAPRASRIWARTARLESRR
jgi:penicillin-insensitive murein endopeptidase